jgi:hypothetical protein
MSRDVRPTSRGWIVSPWFDTLFLVNAVWPLFFLVAYASEGFEGRAGVQFWQVYFVTTPHRWITLLVVFLDRDRLRERPAMFVGLATLVIAGCLAMQLTTGALTCLLTIDYIWNAWHFAAQHHGIYRLYGRVSNTGPTAWLGLEKFSMRLFLLYVIVRVAGGTWSNPGLERWLLGIDWAILVVPTGLLAADALKPREAAWGRIAYLLSVCTLYVSLLWSVHVVHPRAVLALTTASALFHAMEYLALVSWSVHQRDRDRGAQLGWLHWFAGRWSLALLVYILILGIGGWFIERQWLETWLLLNLMAAYLHYAYDGLIWRRPRRTSIPGPMMKSADVVA